MNAPDPKELARLREAFASLSDGDSPAPVDAGRIFDALHGRLSPEARRSVVDELLVNPEAARAWRLAREMATEDAGPVPLPIAPSHRPRCGPSWVAIAAAVVVTLGLGWQLLPSSPREPVYRGVETRAIASALPPGATLSRRLPVLRWDGLDGARYRVRVLTPDLEVLEESEDLTASDYNLSEGTLRRIRPGGLILWQVEGRVPDGTVIVSPTYRIEVP